MDRKIGRELHRLVADSGIRSLAAYRAFDGEPDLDEFLHELHTRDIQLLLPVLDTQFPAKNISFCRWSTDGPVRKNKFGITEPILTDPVPVKDIDLMLIPLVACDQVGNRLGMGGGYYDRALASVAHSDVPIRIGVAYQLQQVEKLPAQSWDIRLHGLVTDAGRFTLPTDPGQCPLPLRQFSNRSHELLVNQERARRIQHRRS